MQIIARLIAASTVLLGLALMAVSAYAAQDERDPAPPADVVTQAQGPAEQNLALFGRAASELAGIAGEPATAARGARARPTPTVELHFAAPLDSAGVTGATGGRSNLSPGVRVWDVQSIKPGEVNLNRLSQQGFEVPADQLSVMVEVSRWSGLPWQVFAGIAKVESDLGRNMATSSAGAIGYGQFLPESWALFGEGGDPYDFHDAIPAMARFLLDAGAANDLSGALYMYNHSWPYVAQVLSYAGSYGYGASPAVSFGPAVRQSLIWPVVGPISSYMGPDHPLGIDIDQTMAPGTPVLAAHDGVVIFAGGDRCCSYGLYAIVMGASGLTTLYGHFDELAVAPGQTVRQGQALGIVGSTGYSTGTHLHFELFDGGVRRNPLDYLP